MARAHDWFTRMAEVIELHAARPFSWGAADCANFVMDAVAAMRGAPDPFVGDRHRYKTRTGAARMMKRYRARSVDDILAREFEECGPALAMVGDIATIRLPDGGTVCGLFVGHEILMRGEEGLCRLPRSRAHRAYRV